MYQNALIAGLFGSFSGICGKISTNLSSCWLLIPFIPSNYYLALLLQIFFFLLNLFFTAMMWTYFIISMKNLSALSSSVLNTGSNFISTAILGSILFDDVLSLRYFFGVSVILVGLGMIIYGEKNEEKTK